MTTFRSLALSVHQYASGHRVRACACVCVRVRACACACACVSSRRMSWRQRVPTTWKRRQRQRQRQRADTIDRGACKETARFICDSAVGVSQQAISSVFVWNGWCHNVNVCVTPTHLCRGLYVPHHNLAAKWQCSRDFLNFANFQLCLVKKGASVVRDETNGDKGSGDTQNRRAPHLSMLTFSRFSLLLHVSGRTSRCS